jgi:hypothetical protein
MEKEDYPALFRSASNISAKYQKRYFCYKKLYLGLLILGTILPFLSSLCSIINVFSLLGFVASLIVFIIAKLDKPEQLWYNGRAVAESVKTRTWRWMMQVEPYQDIKDDIKRRNTFQEDLKQILQDNTVIFKKLAVGESFNDNIIFTKLMDCIYQKEWKDKLKFYKKYRIEDKYNWYCEKTKQNKHCNNIYFGIIIVLYILIIILMGFNIRCPSQWYPIGILSIMASTFITWIQAKRYNELHDSYALTTYDISLFAKEDINEKDFSNYVINSENAFSREHAQWYAKKLS